MSFTSGGGPIASAFVEVTANTGPAVADIARMVAALGRLDDVAKQVSDSIARSFKDAASDSERALKGIDAESFARLRADAKAAGSDVENSFEGSSGRSKAALSGIAVGLGALATAGAAAGGALVGFGLQQAAALEQTQIGFKSLLGSAEAADKFIREMQAFAASTPFEFQGLADNARQLLATGNAIKVTRDQIIPTIGIIGDLVAVLGAPPDSIDRVITAFAQMASKGKASTEELLQVAEALPGFPIFEAMAKGLGITTQALQEQVSAGLVPADKAVQAVLKGMKEFPGAAGAMAEQAQTLTGLFSTFKDTISLTVTQAFQPLVGQVKTALAPLTTVVGESLNQLAPAISSVASSLLNAVIPLVKPLAGIITSVLEPLGGLITEVAKAFEPLLKVVGTLISTLLPPLVTIIKSVLSVLNPLLKIVGEVAVRLITAFAPVLNTIAEAISTKLAPVLIRVVEILGDSLIRVLDRLAPPLLEIVTLLAENFVTTLEAIAPVLPELAVAFGDLAIALTELLIATIPILPPLIQLSILFTKNIGAPVLLLVANAIRIVAGALANLSPIIAPLLTVVGLLGLAFIAIKNNIDPIISTIITTLRPVFEDLRVGVLAPILAIISEQLIPKFIELKDIAFGAIANFITTVLKPAFDDFRLNVLEPLRVKIADEIMPKLMEFKDTILTPISEFITNTLRPAFLDFKDNVLTPLGTYINDTLIPVLIRLKDEAFQTINDFITNTLKPTLDDLRLNVLDPLKKEWDENLKPALISLLNDALIPLWNFIVANILPSFRELAKIITENADTLKILLIPATITARAALTFLEGGIILLRIALDVTGFAIKAIVFVLSSMVSAFQTAKDIVSTTSDIILGFGRTINGVIGNVNNFINTLNRIPAINLPSIPKIPGFAAGGIIKKDTLAQLHAPEVVIPLNDRNRALQLAKASGLLDMISASASRPNRSGGQITSNSSGISAGGITIESVQVNFNSDVTPTQARDVATAFVDSVEQTIQRRQLALAVRSV